MKSEFNFERHRIDKFSKEKIITELERVAQLCNYTVFGKRDFAKLANISAGPAIKTFGNWTRTIETLKKHLKTKNIELKPRKKQVYSDGQLFDELERIWEKLGHRPSRIEWESSSPKISYNCYKNRFAGWTNACLSFIEYKMGRAIVIENWKIDISESKTKNTKTYKRRNINLRTRLDILKRDNFRCVFCGRSPALEVGVILHIDHIKPFSKGGESTKDNLQTLCSDCNLGKSNNNI